ncbi:tetraacyldisaccharide 4'-kinase [uncultured Planktomarina sp.]|uniref:tetraacyldisaccharide 4'-kinase n=1 Tax=uncultured Planktomarina sp. TaxID=1538529 RepID=UPI00326167A6
MIRTPPFWHQPRGVLAYGLWPLGWLYGVATAWRQSRALQAHHAPCPVICVGNINAGGTGKTPVVIALAEHLKKRGRQVVVLSRGYGGTIAMPTLVDPKIHGAAEVGDEPLLTAAFCTVVVARKRVEGLALALAQKPDVILMDDGFQDPSVQKDFSIVVVNATLGFGNGFCVPAGPLREPLAKGLARADLCLSIGDAAAQRRFAALGPDQAHFRVEGQIKPLLTGMPWQGLPVFAFAGIAHPEKFFSTLRDLGANILGCEALLDHEPLSLPLMKRLAAKARSLNAQLVCTEKDAVRLPAQYQRDVLALPVRLEIKDWSKIDAKIINLGL